MVPMLFDRDRSPVPYSAYILGSPMSERILAFLVQFITHVIKAADTPALLR